MSKQPRKFVYYRHIASGRLDDMLWNEWEHVQRDPQRKSQFEFIRVIDLDNPGNEPPPSASGPVTLLSHEPPPIEPDDLQCPLCEHVAKNEKALKLHKSKKHG